MNYITCLLLLPLYIVLGCKEKDFNKQIEISKSSIKVNCGLENAENKIFQLEEVVSKNKLIDSISNHKNGISLMSDSLQIDKVNYYEIKAGYNSEIRYETYYIFYVEKGNCNNIKIFEPIEGNIIKLSEWRINNKKKETPILSEKTLSKSDFSNANAKFPIIDKKVVINGSAATSVYELATNVFLTWFDGDNERWYVVTIKDNILVDKKLVGKSETLETNDDRVDKYIDFFIDKNLDIKLEYSTGKGFDSRKIIKTEKYFINEENLKIESRN